MLICTLSILLSPVAMPTPPDARIDPHVTIEHGVTRVDPYAWIRNRENPEVLALLEAENAYADAMTVNLEPLRQTLYDEYLSRIVEDDQGVPWYGAGGFLYRSRTVEGKDYPIIERSRNAQREWSVVLDENSLAEEGGHSFFNVTAWDVSPGGQYLAWLEDTSGDEHCTLRIRDLSSGELLGDQLEDVGSFSLAWLDNEHLFYSRMDEASRPYQVWRHVLGTDVSDDALVWQEDDGRFYTDFHRLRDGAGLVISLGSQTTGEVLYIPSHTPVAQPVSVLGRTPGWSTTSIIARASLWCARMMQG